MLRVCTKCGEGKDASCFSKKLDSLTTRCKVCLSEDRVESYKDSPDSRKKAANDYYQNNKEKVLSRLRVRYSENPQKHLNAVNERKQRDVEAHNKRFRELQTIRHAANPSVQREKSQNYRSKKRGNGGRLSKGIVAHLIDAQNGKCVYCHKDLTSYHVDHIYPISAGGLNEDGNVQLLCPRCNLQKGAKIPEDFIAIKGVNYG
jgi:5-methylcytosine-specific restriction endonuclease McrA